MIFDMAANTWRNQHQRERQLMEELSQNDESNLGRVVREEIHNADAPVPIARLLGAAALDVLFTGHALELGPFLGYGARYQSPPREEQRWDQPRPQPEAFGHRFYRRQPSGVGVGQSFTDQSHSNLSYGHFQHMMRQNASSVFRWRDIEFYAIEEAPQRLIYLFSEQSAENNLYANVDTRLRAQMSLESWELFRNRLFETIYQDTQRLSPEEQQTHTDTHIQSLLKTAKTAETEQETKTVSADDLDNLFAEIDHLTNAD